MLIRHGWEGPSCGYEFDNAARDHESDYGEVNEAKQSGTADVAASPTAPEVRMGLVLS